MNDPLKSVSKYKFVGFLGEGAIFPRLIALDTPQLASASRSSAVLPGLAEYSLASPTLMLVSFTSRHVWFCGTSRKHGDERAGGDQVDHLAIVMEYVGGGTLQGWVERNGRLPEWQCRCFFQQLVLALHYSHKSLGISHRDIKLGNILLNDKYQVPILKLCDFGYSKDYSPVGSLPKTRVGTAAYISPEVAGASAGKGAYDSEKADVWSSAVTLYCMLAGRYPFMNGNKAPDLYQIKKLQDRQVDDALDALSGYGVSKECKDLLKQALRVNPPRSVMGLMTSWQTLGIVNSFLISRKWSPRRLNMIRRTRRCNWC